MANRCDICGRTPQFGHAVSHSKRAANRLWSLNIQKHTFYVNGKAIRLNVCARCLRTQHKQATARREESPVV
jgi:large subunit ribosomal protein L28